MRSIKANLFPFLEKYNLIYPMKATNKNYEVFKKQVKEYCDQSEDPKSIFNQIISANEFKRDDVYCDIIGLMGAGMDTTSTAVAC
jgi:cytochrome P450